MANLITLNQYKQAKGLTGDKEDSKLNFLIPSVSQLIKTYCHNSFVDYVDEPYEEYFTIDYPEINIVQLSQSPILEIETVRERYYDEAAYTVLDTTYYRVDRKSDTLKKTLGSWPVGTESIQVSYTAGYEELPVDLYLAAIDLVSYYLKEEYRTNKTIQGTSQHTPAGTTMRQDIGFPDHIRRVLDLYRHFD